MSTYCSRRTEAGERLLVSAGASMSRSVELQADLTFRAFFQFIVAVGARCFRLLLL